MSATLNSTSAPKFNKVIAEYHYEFNFFTA